MVVGPDLQQIFERELRRRVDEMGLALSQTGTHDMALRERSLYEAHLHAHTLKGTAEQLGHLALSRCAAAMCDELERARDRRLIAIAAVERMERGLALMAGWADAGGQGHDDLLLAFAEEMARTQ